VILLSLVLTTPFNLLILYSHIPTSFGCSYTVPIAKRDGHGHAVSVDDFSCSSISPIISKLLEMAIFDRFSVYFITPDHQCDFLKPELQLWHYISDRISLVFCSCFNKVWQEL